MPRHASLGGFELLAAIGRGGMGEVWRGRHVPTGRLCAVKVISARASDAGERHAYFEEVRAMARLAHPNVVRVYDRGEVTPDEARDGLEVGARWLAMELAEHGSLAKVALRRWEEVEEVLGAILAGLAHAHASGIVHRDLKPANVLRFRSHGPDAWRLGDFGIAHAMRDRRRRGGERARAVGTPAYMAPEQIRGRWRDFGPWTDLYALGCVAWELTTGRRPLDGPDRHAILRAHLGQELPPFAPSVPVPEGFEEWVRRLLEKHPADRWQLAADAAWALQNLGPASVEPVAREARAESSPRSADTWFTSTTAPTDPLEPGRPKGPRQIPYESPPIPPCPDVRARFDAGTALGTGTGLFGLRAPLIGRREEQRHLWEALRETRRGGRARLVVLRGERGVGKTRLADWLCEQSHEVGAARSMIVRSDPSLQGPVPVARAVSRLLRTDGLGADALHGRTAQWLVHQGVSDPAEHALLSEVQDSSTSLAPRERHAAVARLLRREAAFRPMILWLDDLHYGPDAVDLAHHLLDRQGAWPAPVLLLGTVAGDGAGLEALLDRAEQVHDLGPLPVDDMLQLVRRLLGLEESLAARLVERVAGNPMFLVQLLGDWVARGLLEPGAGGLTLSGGPSLPVTVDLAEAWHGRLEAFLAGRAAEDGPALEIAGILGLEVDEGTWAEACRHAGVPLGEDLADALLDQLLAIREPGVLGRFRFAHGMLREVLARRAATAGRDAAHHAACAGALMGVAEEEPGRLGRHLLAAGDHEAALDLLLGSARRRFRCSDLREVHADLGHAQAALAAVDPPPGDPRWTELGLIQCRATALAGRREEAWSELAVLLEHSRAHAPRHLLVRVLVLAATIARTRGRIDEGGELVREALALADPATDPAGHYVARRCEAVMLVTKGCYDDALVALRALDELGPAPDEIEASQARLFLVQVLLRLNRLDEAEQELDRSRRLLEVTNDRVHLAHCAMLQADLLDSRGRDVEALATYDRAIELFELIGDMVSVSNAINDRSEVLRRRGELVAAEQGYRQALRIVEGLLDTGTEHERVNLGLVLVIQGRVEEGRRELEEARACYVRYGRSGYVAAVDAFLVACLAHDPPAFASQLAQAAEGLSASGFYDHDVIETLELAGRRASEAGHRELARQAWRVALREAEAHADASVVERLRARLELPGGP